MGEAKRKRNEWVRLFEPPLQVRMAISRPGARPVSTQKYERNMPAFINKPNAKPALCFNLNCNNKLLTIPDVYLFIQTEKDAQPLGMGVCVQCARYSDDELRALARDQFGDYYGLDQQPPENSARAEIECPPGLGFTIAGVSFFMSGRETPSIPGGPTVFVNLLEAGQLPEFITLRRGISNCHGIVNALYHDLDDAGCAGLFAYKRGSSNLLKSAHDSKGLHSWIEIKGWAIDAANGANRPVIIMPTDDYYKLLQITNVHDIGEME